MTNSVPAGLSVRPRQAGVYAALLALLVMTAGPAGAQDKDPVVAKVNGVEIHQSDLAVAEDEAAFRRRDQTVMVVPKRLVPAITKLIKREETVAARKRPNAALEPSASARKKRSPRRRLNA